MQEKSLIEAEAEDQNMDQSSESQSGLLPDGSTEHNEAKATLQEQALFEDEGKIKSEGQALGQLEPSSQDHSEGQSSGQSEGVSQSEAQSVSEVMVDVGSESLLEIAEGKDVLTLTQDELDRLDRRPLNIDGFRLERVDVYNWGSFNNNVKSVYFGGQNVLMTGDNGAGKSSIIDAITVLLYDVKKVTFNQAAGAEKGERNLASYVLGLYKNDNSSGVKTELGLRSKDKAVLTVIMASFYNQKLDEHVVLVQCMVMMKPKTSPSRYYFISNKDFNLQQDVLPVKDIRELGAKLKKLGATRFEQFGEYYSQMQRLFGIDNTKVLDLFYKTISMKSISNISDFVRKQMLEDFNGDDLVEQLVERFNDLDASYKSVEEAKKQVESLEPICKKGEEYKYLQSQIEFLSKCEAGAPPYLFKKKADFLLIDIEKSEQRIAQLDNENQQNRLELDRLDSQISSTRSELDQQGGHRIELLNENLRNLRAERNSVYNSYSNFNRLLAQLGLEAINTSSAFDNLKQKLSKLKEKLANDLSSFEESADQRTIDQDKIATRMSELGSEIKSLVDRKNNIPSRYIDFRRELITSIGCKESDLPFAGELMQIKPSEKDKWEYAIEKVLHSLAVSMLVPEQYYRDVTEYVNTHNLGMRLVFYRINEHEFNSGNSLNTSLGSQFGSQLNGFGRRGGSETLPRKIEIKNDPVFKNYLKQTLESKFNYVCTEDTQEFRQERMALTPSGMSKVGTRNEKDDRRSRSGNDFVLGWDNQDKIALLKSEYSNLNHELLTIKEAIRSLKQGRSTINNNILAIDKLLGEYQSYTRIDYHSCDERIARVEEELAELQKTNNIFATLQKRLEQYIQERNILNERNQTCLKEIGQLQFRNDSNRREYQNALDLSETAQYLSEDVVNAIEILVNKALGRLRLSQLEYEYIDMVMAEIQSRLKDEIGKLKSNESSIGQELVNMQSRFCQTFVVAARNLDASRAAAWEDFKVFLDKLMTDDLPRFVDAFKDKLNRETIDQLGTLNAALITHCRKIKERIADINIIMKDVDFNVDRYIQMEARENPDVEIKQFRIDLRNCTSTSSEDGSLENAEARFYQVKALIDRFKGEVNGADIDRRWRNKVTDVKQWFDFAASEHSRIDDSQTDYYEDSGGKSGGQKEKLAYTVLASSIAYQYRSKARQKGGLSVNSALDQGMSVDDVVQGQQIATPMSYNYADRSYRFVIIDEAFGRGSPQSVDYALTLFSKFNLQLLIATPMQKLDIIEKYVNHVAFVYRDEESHESTVVNYELDDYIIKRKLKEQIARAPFMSSNAKLNGDSISSLSAEKASELYNKLDERILNEQARFAGPRASDDISDKAQNIIKQSAAPKSKGTKRKTKDANLASEQASLEQDSEQSSLEQASSPSELMEANAQSEPMEDKQEVLFSDELEPVSEDNVENKGDLLKLKDTEGNFLDADEYAAKMQEERMLSEQKRTEAALSKLDFLESFYQDDSKEPVDDAVIGVVSDDLDAKSQEGNSSPNQSPTSKDSTKRSKKHEEEEEPKYSHSLDELLVLEDEED